MSSQGKYGGIDAPNRTQVPRPRALVAHPYWGRGGAEAAAMWAISALVKDFDVTVFTRGGFELRELNLLAGTQLNKRDISVCLFAASSIYFATRLQHRQYLLHAKRLAPEYDLRFTASGSIDFGLPAVHFLSSLAWHPRLNSLRSSGPRFADGTQLGRLMRRFLDRVVPVDISISIDDLFIANSKWTAAASSEWADGHICVIYPPLGVLLDSANGTQLASSPAFKDRVLCFGRVSPEKRIEDCIDVIAIMERDLGVSCKLDVAGPVSSVAYQRYLQRYADHRGVELTFIGEVREDKFGFLSQYLFGISCCDVEAFGLATAEMSYAGIVVVAPTCTAQSEILEQPEQLYGDLREAAQKLKLIMSSEQSRQRLSASARARCARFSPLEFSATLRHEVKEFVNTAGVRSSYNSASDLNLRPERL